MGFQSYEDRESFAIFLPDESQISNSIEVPVDLFAKYEKGLIA